MRFQHSWTQVAGCSEVEDHTPQVGQSSKQRVCDTHPDKATKPRAKVETQLATKKGSDNEFISQTHKECPGSAQSPKEAQEVGSTCLANREAWLGMGNVNRKEMGTHFITRLAESKAVAGAAHGRPVGNRHCLQLMSCVTFMVNQPVGSMSTCIPFTLAKSCLLMVPLQAISHSLWHLECSQSSPAGDC
jgi:hypothetical protein